MFSGRYHTFACEDIHHVQRISMVAAVGEAAGIHRAIMNKKQARCADMQKRARSGAA